MKGKTIIMLMAGLGTLLLLFLLAGERRPFSRSDTDFAVADGSEISRIVISSDDGRVTLEKDDSGEWMVNGRVEARKSSILFIIRVLTEIRIKSPVSPELFSDEIASKGIEAVKVTVYDNRRMLRSFLVYRTHSNIYGNIMKISERSKPFIVYVPGYENDIAAAFGTSHLFWQNFTVFTHLPSSISSVRLDNHSDTSSSFMLILKGDDFVLSANGKEMEGADQGKIRRYISYFTRVPFESWAFDISDSEKSEIESSEPAYEITLTPVEGEPVLLTLWHRFSGTGPAQTRDTDRLWGRSQHGDNLFVVRYFDIDPLLKKRSYFFSD